MLLIMDVAVPAVTPLNAAIGATVMRSLTYATTLRKWLQVFPDSLRVVVLEELEATPPPPAMSPGCLMSINMRSRIFVVSL